MIKKIVYALSVTLDANAVCAQWLSPGNLIIFIEGATEKQATLKLTQREI
ncbi:hypothetical protein BDD43_0232 [Mucilaginibacter gracilis]|uniref:Uncharacterized protein n=1 Tax=Mucilaginibacter gracilis TaxID=423350 RepID=A0A495ITP6_9SPHI|nr:hypothetical protein [Mucilaginibacter gracilis]RKR80137.1 hypothetical protein BDD43_0232 [Mucilaginibacter gracilis]